ncbi:MAG: hypothetical protein IJG50_07690 [Clostridia bacterium]|nr:hypothetical protein [Clostridia bacterium]
MSMIIYTMMEKYLMTMQKYSERLVDNYEKGMARLEAKDRARAPWLYCDMICYECKKETFDSCRSTLKMTYNRYSNPF